MRNICIYMHTYIVLYTLETILLVYLHSVEAMENSGFSIAHLAENRYRREDNGSSFFSLDILSNAVKDDDVSKHEISG